MSNKEIDLAWQLVQNTGCNVFLTGKAGTGKTTFLRRLVAETYKRNVVLAPTGIAAINAHGVTLHSFFQLPFGPYIPGSDPRKGERNYRVSENKRRLIRSLDLVIIDEISMVRADLLDCMDAVLRRYRDRTKPFGGLQLLLIGDLQQLAPVTKQEEWDILKEHYDTPYFFSSHNLREAGYVAVELQEVYRQTDNHFVELLNRIRNNQADQQVLAELNARHQPEFSPPADAGYIRLTTHNWQADQINDQELAALDTEPHTYEAEIWKEFPELSYPTAQHLTLKVGAQVMFVKNDSDRSKRYYNGMLGTVTAMGENFIRVLPQDGDEVICVTPEQWQNTRYKMNEETKEIEEELIGTFTQYPLKTAWAITVHKSQGLTFDRAIIDVQHSFTHGQTYVALSRCRSLEGLVLSTPIPPRAIITDPPVVAFTAGIADQMPDTGSLATMQRQYFLQLFAELFTFHPLRAAYDAYLRHIEEWFHRQYHDTVSGWKALRLVFEEEVQLVAVRFSLQYQQMIIGEDYADKPELQERCKRGAAYFRKKVEEVELHLQQTKIVTRNKSVGERLVALHTDFAEALRQKLCLLRYAEKNGFTVEGYLRERDLVSIGPDEQKAKPEGKSRKTTKTATQKSATAYDVLEDILADSNSYIGEDLSSYDDLPDLSCDELPY